MNNYLKAFIHNAIVHPLVMFLPSKLADRIHDANAKWAFTKGEKTYKYDNE